VTTNDKAILNSLSDVEEIYIHDFDGVLCRIKPKYFLPIRLTPEHPVLVREVKRYAWKNRYVFLGESYFLPSDKLTKYQRDKQINLRVAIPKIIRSEKTIVKLGKKTTFETDYELGVIFGTYFADGYFLEKSRYISFDFNRKTEIVKAEEFRRILGRKGFKSSIIPKNNVISVYVCNVALGRYLKLMFGADCYSKHIPYWIFETNNAFLEGIIDGALNDGCFSPSSNSHYISTVSEELARGLQLISWKLRRPTSVSVRKPNRICIIEGRTVNEVPLFSVRWSKNPAKIVEDEKYYWVSILKVEREEYKGKVYNFSTAENIYSLPIVVHNCHPIADGFRDLLLANPRGALRPIDRIIKVGLMLPPEQQEHFTYLCRRWLKLQNGNGKE
jgi:intein/homing endonuclease